MREFITFQWEFIFVRHYVRMWFTSCMIVGMRSVRKLSARAALLGVVGLPIWAGGGLAEDEEAAAPRVPETDRGDELRPPPAQPGEDRPPRHRVEAVLLVV